MDHKAWQLPHQGPADHGEAPGTIGKGLGDLSEGQRAASGDPELRQSCGSALA